MTQIRITLATGHQSTISGDKINLAGDLIKVWKGSALVAIAPSTALVEMLGDAPAAPEDDANSEAPREFVNEIVGDEF